MKDGANKPPLSEESVLVECIRLIRCGPADKESRRRILATLGTFFELDGAPAMKLEERPSFGVRYGAAFPCRAKGEVTP